MSPGHVIKCPLRIAAIRVLGAREKAQACKYFAKSLLVVLFVMMTLALEVKDGIDDV